MTATAGSIQARWAVINGLRRWADGAATDQAAVELLISLGARFTQPGRPWIRPCRRPGWYWLDPEPLTCFAGRLSGHEHWVLTLVVALLSDDPAISGAIGARAESGRAAA